MITKPDPEWEKLVYEARTLLTSAEGLRLLVYTLIKDQKGRNVRLTDAQLLIVQDIILLKYDELAIAAATGYGKTFTVSIGLLLCAVINDGIKIGIISTIKAQSSLSYNYMLFFISQQPLFNGLVGKVQGDNNIKNLSKVLNRENMTIGNSSISILTANLNKSGSSLLGQHFDIVLLDEAAMIPDYIVNVMIERMLETRPTDAYKKCFIKISTTHHRGHFKDWVDDPNVKTYVITAETGVREGMFDQKYLDKRLRRMGQRDYDIWYMCIFPELDSDCFFTLTEIKELVSNTPLDEKYFTNKGYEKCLAIDVSRFGGDKTVYTLSSKVGHNVKSKYLHWHSGKSLSHSFSIACQLIDEYKPEFIVVDTVGLGAGLYDMLLDKYYDDEYYNFIEFKSGRKCDNKLDALAYRNQASLVYDFLRKLIREKKIEYEFNEWIGPELEGVTYEFNNNLMHVSKKSNKPDNDVKSPDFVDSFVYSLFIWANMIDNELIDY